MAIPRARGSVAMLHKSRTRMLNSSDLLARRFLAPIPISGARGTCRVLKERLCNSGSALFGPFKSIPTGVLWMFMQSNELIQSVRRS